MARREKRELSEASDLEADVLLPEDGEGLVARLSKAFALLETDAFSESFCLNIEACSLLIAQFELGFAWSLRCSNKVKTSTMQLSL